MKISIVITSPGNEIPLNIKNILSGAGYKLEKPDSDMMFFKQGETSACVMVSNKPEKVENIKLKNLTIA